MSARFFRLAMMVAVVLSGWANEARPAEPLKVFVSLPPQKEFVERLGGNRVHVTALVPPGADPHTYEPSPAQMKALTQASLYFSIGIPFEKNLLGRVRSLNPQLQVVATDEGLSKRPITGQGHAHEHIHGEPKDRPGKEAEDSHGHDEGEPDPHVWLSPPMVMAMARPMVLALIAADPADQPGYEARYKNFLQDVAALDLEIHKTFRDAKPPREFYVFHPSWGYFADAYGLRQVAVESEGKEAKPAHLKELVVSAREKGVTTLFVQPQFSKRSAEMVAKEIGAHLESLDPLAENWMDNLRLVSRRIREAMP